jgi:RNA polymerase primary sigma factor
MWKLNVSPPQAVQAPLATYFRDINDIPCLNAEEEKGLAGRVKEGDCEARDQMVRANLHLVVNIARGYLGRGLALEDLIAEGNLGLMRAVRGFDPSLNTRFSTFANYWIKATIRLAILHTGKPIRIPTSTCSLLVKWRRASARLQEERGRPPTAEEVARRLDLTPQKLRNILHAVHIANAMPKTGYAFEEWSPENDLPDHRSSQPDSHLVHAEELRRVRDLLDKLGERKVRVLHLRFGLGDEGPCTFEEIGRRFGLSRERVRQIEKGALAELAKSLRGV